MDKKDREAKLKAIKGAQNTAISQDAKTERDRVLGAKFEMFRHLKELSISKTDNKATGKSLAEETNVVMEIIGL